MPALHEITAACWGALGRRVLPGAMEKAKNLSPRPTGGVIDSSENIEMIQAVNDAVVHHDYRGARVWFERMRTVGTGEAGPLYGPAGQAGYCAALASVARLDGERGVEREALGYLAWWRDHSSEFAVPRPVNVVAIGPDGRIHDENPNPP